MREENVGVGNQGYVADRDGNQNSVATAEEIELVNIGLYNRHIVTLSNIVVAFDMLQQYIRLGSPHRHRQSLQRRS